MPERTEKLRTTLAELHQELADAGGLDPESRALLQEILDALANAPSGAGLQGHPLPLIERLREAGPRLEAKHPELAAVVGRLLDTLASLGI
jgi:hypothetical protein